MYSISLTYSTLILSDKACKPRLSGASLSFFNVFVEATWLFAYDLNTPKKDVAAVALEG